MGPASWCLRCLCRCCSLHDAGNQSLVAWRAFVGRPNFAHARPPAQFCIVDTADAAADFQPVPARGRLHRLLHRPWRRPPAPAPAPSQAAAPLAIPILVLPDADADSSGETFGNPLGDPLGALEAHGTWLQGLPPSSLPSSASGISFLTSSPAHSRASSSGASDLLNLLMRQAEPGAVGPGGAACSMPNPLLSRPQEPQEQAALLR